MYTEKVMEYFKNPLHAGKLENADVIAKVGNPKCVVKDTMVFSNSEIKKIMELEKNNLVLSHDGKYNKILKKFKRKYKGKIYNLDIWNLGKIQITPEHHILTKRITRSKNKSKHHKKYMADWFSAQELKKGDYLLYPIPKEIKDKKIIDFDIPKPKYDFKSKELPSKIKVDNNFLKLVGFYLSEGYVRTKKCNGTLGFCFGSHEKDYVEETKKLMKKIFNIDSKIYEYSNSIVITYYSARLARFFNNNFGKGAANKQLPHWMTTLPRSKQKAILSGLWQGDGYVNGKTAKFVTISKQLAYQTALLLLRQKILFSFLISPEKGMHKKHYSIYIKQQTSLKKIAELMKKEIKFPKIKEAKHRSWFGNNYLYVPIRNISTQKFSGLVYNLEVKNSHSYISSCATLHNCGDVMEIYLKISDGIVKEIKFQTFGCAAAISASEALCRLVEGKTIEEIKKITNKDIAEHLGGLPPLKVHCSVLGAEALKKAIEKYENREKS